MKSIIISSNSTCMCVTVEDCALREQHCDATLITVPCDADSLCCVTIQPFTDLERKLRLTVNRSNSAVAQLKFRKFPEQRVLGGKTHKYLGIHSKSVKRVKVCNHQITHRNSGIHLDQVLQELRPSRVVLLPSPLSVFADAWEFGPMGSPSSSLLRLETVEASQDTSTQSAEDGVGD